MGTVKANNFEQASKELEAIDKSLVTKVSDKIKIVDQFHYHVALIKIIAQPGKVQNKTSVFTQTYHELDFQKAMKNYRNNGYNFAVLLHNPVKQKKEGPVTIPTHKIQKSEAEIRAELQAEYDAKFEKAMAKQTKVIAKEVKQEVNQAPEEPFKLSGIRAMNKEQLVAFAAENEIALGEDTGVRVILPLIVKWAEKKNSAALKAIETEADKEGQGNQGE